MAIWPAPLAFIITTVVGLGRAATRLPRKAPEKTPFRFLASSVSYCIPGSSKRMAQTVKLNNGSEIPILGLGTWKSKPGEVTQAVKDAIDIGYRHIDGAHVYGNEKEVGEALSAKIKEGVIKREDIFITSKLWNTFHRPDLVQPALQKTLKDLNLDYLDLYLMHWPFAFKEEGDLFPMENNKVQFSDVDFVDTWKEMEKLVKQGLTKSIGISNFNKEQTERILSVAEIKPVTNQVECHPYLNQNKLIEYSSSKGITITAYSPLGSPDRPGAKPGEPGLLDDPKILEIAKRLEKSPGQVLIRYQIQRGIIVIPKSVNKGRIQSNFEVFDFNLSDSDMKVLQGLESGKPKRFVPFNDAVGHKYYPFDAEY